MIQTDNEVATSTARRSAGEKNWKDDVRLGGIFRQGDLKRLSAGQSRTASV